MKGELCLRLFAKFIIHISLLLWQLSHEFKFQTTAQNTTDLPLPEEEVSTLNIVANSLGYKRSPESFSQTYCKAENSSYYSAVSYSYGDGVYCNCSFNHNTACHINEIRWINSNLNGYLPEEVANLTYLERLLLYGNEIQGEIPATLGNLRRLYYLGLAGNQLTGTIPNSLGSLTVKFLYLSNNLFTGPIPPSLGNISSLIRLYSSRNQLEGSLPSELGHLTSLRYLSLYRNQLNGPLPSELGNLTSLIGMDLSENQLNGPVPQKLGNLVSLQGLYLSENQLSGPLPSELGNLKSLTDLYLYSNCITGDLPGGFEKLSKMEIFLISGNYLSSPFPEFIRSWTSIKNLSLYGNNFTGEIPREIFNLSSLVSLEISDVKASPNFQFPQSASLTSITTLVLRNCSITGPISHIANMPQLKYLDLSFNSLTGRIPSELKFLNLSYMSFANNYLSGPILTWISHAAKLTQIDLSFNQFEGFEPHFDFSQKIRSNLNLFSCCPSCNSNNCERKLIMIGLDRLKEEFCAHKSKKHSLYINCGGPKEKDRFGNQYDQDDSMLPYGMGPNGENWAFSSSGNFLSTDPNSSDFIKYAKCAFPVVDSPLYSKARFAPVSLKYYGFCLHQGNYSVTLRFAEIVYTGDDEDHSNWKKRMFDVYIQNKLVKRNFQILNKTVNILGANNKTKVSTVKIEDIENQTTKVENDGLLQIHLYWAGMGSLDDFNGPLLSSISTQEIREKGPSRLKIPMIIFGSITFAVLLLLAFAWMMGWLAKEELHEITVGDGKTVTHKQLIVATRGFSKDMEIGRGGFGTVYRAELLDRRIVAVKKLSTLSNEGIEKLKVGIYNLQNLRHDNLVRLFDIYVGKDLRFLVYEYMENKSLADALFEHKIKLNWDARFNICVGIAKGLQYLHDHPRLKMVHWGIKAANILLDGQLKPKISDLGLASTSVENENETSHFLWMMKTEASTGYMAPEYPTIGKKSGYKYDVYSFGVVMLEIVCGRKNVGAGLKNKHELELLVDEVCIADSKGKLPSLVDESLSGTYDMKQAMTILKLAIKCTHISPGVRPTMSQVVSVLVDGKPLDEISMPASKEDEKTIEGSSEDLAKDADQFSATTSS